jgi:hypothetical protein
MLQGVAAAILDGRSGFGHRGQAGRGRPCGPIRESLLGPHCEQPGGRGCRAASGPWRSPTFARPARPSAATPPGARPAPLRPPQPADPPLPAPPPGPEPPSGTSTMTRHPPGRPARRGGLAAAWGPAHPRCCPSPSACSQPPLPGSAGRAASRPASPCSARRTCRWRRTRPRQWAGGRQARPAPQRSPRSAPGQGGGRPHHPAAAPRW